MSGIHRLSNPIKDYAWGSHHAIAGLLGQPVPSPGPQAEIWMGSHPSSPSLVQADGGTVGLDELIRSDPGSILGPWEAARFDAELPFMLKVLAASRPLSIQVHPDLVLARLGFERENALGIPLEHPSRCYRDGHHKPELLVALGRFVALTGFRRATATGSLVRALGVPSLEELTAALEEGDGGLTARDLFSGLLGMETESRGALVDSAARAAARLAGRDPAFEWIARLAQEHPGDAGVLAPLLLNLVILDHGQALFLPAGRLHAYLEGWGIEIMACSDNVVRGGLTGKHVDTRELMSVASFEASDPGVIEPGQEGPYEWSYRTPAHEFALSAIRLPPGARHETKPGHGIEILLATEGRAEIAPSSGDRVGMARGESVLVEASASGYVIAGDGDRVVWRARVPHP